MLICLTVSAMQLLKTRWCTEPSNVAATGIIYSFSQTEVLVFVLGVWWHADTLHETLSLTLNCWQKETRLLARFHWKTSAKNQVRHPRIQPFKTSAYWLTLLRMDRCAYFQDFRNLRGKSYDLTFFLKISFFFQRISTSWGPRVSAEVPEDQRFWAAHSAWPGTFSINGHTQVGNSSFKLMIWPKHEGFPLLMNWSNLRRKIVHV